MLHSRNPLKRKIKSKNQRREEGRKYNILSPAGLKLYTLDSRRDSCLKHLRYGYDGVYVLSKWQRLKKKKDKSKQGDRSCEKCQFKRCSCVKSKEEL